jgi:hypothetical protein
VRGSSTTRLLRFTDEHPPGLVSIGSEPGVAWLVGGGGVEARHLELFWDGQAVWVTETHHGEVNVEGDAMGNMPRRVYRGQVEFGECLLRVDSVFAAEVRPLAAWDGQPQDSDDQWSGQLLRAS